MIVIFSSMTVAPSWRSELDVEILTWLDATAHDRSAAEIYKFMADPVDPSKVYVFQAWPDDAAFSAWTQKPAFEALLAKLKREDRLTDVSAVVIEGCQSTRGGPV